MLYAGGAYRGPGPERSKGYFLLLRRLLDGLYGLDPDADLFKPHTVMRRGKEKVVQPYYSVEDYRQMYEIKWRELEPILRAYYA